MNVSVISWSISLFIILLVVVGQPTRNKRMANGMVWYNRLSGGSNRPNGGNVQQPCSPNNQCGKGYGDCETDRDCRQGLLCGKNNCKGEFGSYSPLGIPWERKDDCCTDNPYYCDPRDKHPSSRRTCCSPSNPCPFSHGDCNVDADCQSGLMCGDNNCKDFHAGAGNKDDCCTYKENGGNQPTVNGGNPLTGNGGSQSNGGLQRFWNNNNRGFISSSGGYRPSIGGFSPNNGAYHPRFGGFSPNNGAYRPIIGGFSPKLSGCEAEPSFRCCTQERPCSLGGGDCTGDLDCQQGLICGSNNCRKFHPNADKKMDCCAFKKIK